MCEEDERQALVMYAGARTEDQVVLAFGTSLYSVFKQGNKRANGHKRSGCRKRQQMQAIMLHTDTRRITITSSCTEATASAIRAEG